MLQDDSNVDIWVKGYMGIPYEIFYFNVILKYFKINFKEYEKQYFQTFQKLHFNATVAICLISAF